MTDWAKKKQELETEIKTRWSHMDPSDIQTAVQMVHDMVDDHDFQQNPTWWIDKMNQKRGPTEQLIVPYDLVLGALQACFEPQTALRSQLESDTPKSRQNDQVDETSEDAVQVESAETTVADVEMKTENDSPSWMIPSSELPFDLSKRPACMLPCLERTESNEQIFRDPGRLDRVYVQVPQHILEKADPVLIQALKTFIKTNIVCTARKSGMRPIEVIAWLMDGTFKRPGFSSCVGTSYMPKAAWTSFRQGFVRCAGGNTSERGLWLMYLIVYRLYAQIGMPFAIYNFCVQNYVTALKLPYPLDIVALHRLEPTLTELELGNFPGLMWKNANPKVTIQAFDSGNLNVVGAETLMDAIMGAIMFEKSARRCRIYVLTLEFDERPRRTSELHARIKDDPSIESHVQTERCNKRDEKKRKTMKSRRDREFKAMHDRQMELQRAITNRVAKKNDLVRQEYMETQRKFLREVEAVKKEFPPDDPERFFVFIYTMRMSNNKPITVELMSDFTVNILGPRDVKQANEACSMVTNLFGAHDPPVIYH